MMKKRQNLDLLITLSPVLFLELFGLVCVFLYSLQFVSQPHQLVATFSISAIAAGAALLAGGLLGFFFGIPKTPDCKGDAESKVSETQAKDRKGQYRPNTNLEEVSDWLTKILIGIGLTQINPIVEQLRKIVGVIQVGLGNTHSSAAFALGLLAYFFICGFVSGFLWTRLLLPSKFVSADEILLQEIDARFVKIEDQIEKDADAEIIVMQHLNLYVTPVENSELLNRIRIASHAAKSRIFIKTKNFCENLTFSKGLTGETASGITRTIPIYKALIEDDPQKLFHRNHFELALALMKQSKPDFETAERELSKAIAIRGDWQQNSPTLTEYECYRAFCRIQLIQLNLRKFDKGAIERDLQAFFQDRRDESLAGEQLDELLDRERLNAILVTHSRVLDVARAIESWMKAHHINLSILKGLYYDGFPISPI